MAEYLTNNTDLKKVADAIRTKGGTSAALTYPDEYVSAINAITTGIELKIVVSVISEAVVTATKGSDTVIGTSVNGVCTLVVPEAGTWSVNATLNGQTSDTKSVSVVDSYAVALMFSFVSSTLNNNEWSVIKSVSDAGQGANYWSVGDRKAVVLNGTVGKLSLSNVTTYAFIIGFNHNASVEGTNRIHFQFGKTAASGGTDICFVDSGYNSNKTSGSWFNMNNSQSNSGGWNSSRMRTVICPAFKSAMPSDLQAVLKTVTKYSDNTGGASDTASYVTATTDDIFLLAEWEVFGARRCANSAEQNYQAQYAYYSAGNSKVRYQHSSTGSTAYWWLRSVEANASNRFCYVTTSGSAYSYGAIYSFGFAPGFCV